MSRLIPLVKNIKRVISLSLTFAFGLTIGLFVITVITSLAPLLQAKILGNIVNHIIDAINSSSAEGLFLLAFAYALVWGGTRIVNALDLYLGKIWRTECEHALDLMVLKKRAEIDLGHYENPRFQNLLQRAFNRGIWPLFELTETQFATIGNLSVIIVSSIITSAISWQIYLIVIITSIPSFVVQAKYGYKVWGIWAEHSPRQRRFAAMRQHLLGRTGITQAKLMQNSGRLLEIIKEVLDAFKKDNIAIDRKRFVMQSVASIITALGLCVSLWLIIKNVVTGNISVGSMVFIISALGSLIGSLNQLLAQLATQLEKNLYVTDIFEVLDTRPFITRSKHPIKLNLERAPVIEFRNVSFRYEGREDLILKNINLTISPGEKVALVGMNGAGKTTLIKLLARIYDPTVGDIFVNGVNLKNVDLEEWSSYLSVLLQDYLSYDLTVSEAIAMSRVTKKIDRKAVEESARYSEAHEFIEEWEKKYDQQLGKEFEGGVEPSKGQHQKIALARTIYRQGYIMVLDEPTASIDALSETKIFEQMEKASADHTLIVITHRFNTTQNLDKIVVIERGEVVEIGTHRELLAKNGRYKEMFESQAKAFRSENDKPQTPKPRTKKPRTKSARI